MAKLKGVRRSIDVASKNGLLATLSKKLDIRHAFNVRFNLLWRKVRHYRATNCVECSAPEMRQGDEVSSFKEFPAKVFK